MPVSATSGNALERAVRRDWLAQPYQRFGFCMAPEHAEGESRPESDGRARMQMLAGKHRNALFCLECFDRREARS